MTTNSDLKKIFGANQNCNCFNLSVAKYLPIGFSKINRSNPHHGQTVKKPFGGLDRFPALVMSSSDHILLSTGTPTRVPSTAFQQISSPYITTVPNRPISRVVIGREVDYRS